MQHQIILSPLFLWKWYQKITDLETLKYSFFSFLNFMHNSNLMQTPRAKTVGIWACLCLGMGPFFDISNVS